MSHGKAIYSHDAEGQRMIAALQYHEHELVLMTAYDSLTERMVTIGLPPEIDCFFRDAASLIDPDVVTSAEVRLKNELRALAAEHEVMTGGRDREITRLNNELTRFQNLLMNSEDDKSIALSEVDNLTQLWGDCSSALQDAQQLLADLNQMLTGYPPEPLLVKLREYVQSHGTIATGEIPF